MVCEPASDSARRARARYARDMAVAFVCYAAFVFGAALAIRNVALPQWLVIALSLAPMAPALMMLRAYLTYTRALDEFQRRVHTEALIAATALVVFGTFAYGFLEEWAGFPRLPVFWVFPIFAAALGFTQILVRRRYK